MRSLLLASLVLAACSTSTSLPSRAPWREGTLSPDSIPAVYLTRWKKAENRGSCALIAPKTVGAAGEGAVPRAAEFSGGWAVAYDLPNLRSAFGVAGAGVSAADPSYNKWPYVHEWGDGSKVEYGPEGGLGPNQLAYLRIHGQDCLYNVWSRISREHLELLLRELRMVQER